MLQDAKVKNNHHRDECFQDQNEFALRDQVGFAGFIDQLGNFFHRAVDRRIFQLHIDDQSEEQTQSAKDQTYAQQLVACD